MKLSYRFLVVTVVASGALLTTREVHAQPEAPPEAAAQFSQAIAEERPDDERTLWTISAGGTLNTGNTESIAGSTSTHFELARGMHSLGAEALFNYIRTTDDAGEATDTQNLNGRLRYDLFFTEMDAAFLALVARHDPQAGLDFRGQAQIGYLRNFFKEDAHRFWGEIGYDFTYDAIEYTDQMTMMLVSDSTDVHAARLFIGYDNQLNEAVTLRTGVEGLINLQEPEDTRINSTTEVNSKLSDSFQLQVKFLLQFDNVPVPGKSKLDTTTQLNLVYTLI